MMRSHNMDRIKKYFMYSGLSIIFQINPMQWSIIPKYTREPSTWDDKAFVFSFLFLTIRFWLDDGSW